MSMFTYNEDLLKFMTHGAVHLSKKDFGFFNNLVHIIKEKKIITSNQDKLFKKLILKYQRQLKKQNYNIDDILSLNWNVEIIETRQEYLDAKIYVKNKFINISLPFSNKFIQDFRKVKNNNFVWNKTKRCYEAESNTHNFKTAYTYTNKHFNNVKYCEQSQLLLDFINNFKDVKYWNPTLLKINDKFYISAINESLHEAIKHIKLSNSPKTLYLLSQFGIKIDESVVNDDDLLLLAANYHIDYDLENIDQLAKDLSLLEVEHVFTSRDIIYNKEISNEIKRKLSQYKITCNKIGSHDKSGILITSTKSYFNNTSMNITKVVYLSNSRPVKVT